MIRPKAVRLSWSGRFTALVALGVLGILFSASGARAGCGMPGKPGAAPPISSLAPVEQNHEGDRAGGHATIVGLWYVVYTATYSTSGPLPVPMVPPNPPFQFNQSYKTWHGDRTEFENAFLPPAAGNICYGVWKNLGHGKVKLHHIGLIFTPEGTLANVFTVDELNTVASDGKTYEGTFDFKVYDPTDVLGTGTVLQEIKGTTAAQRITVN